MSQLPAVGATTPASPTVRLSTSIPLPHTCSSSCCGVPVRSRTCRRLLMLNRPSLRPAQPTVGFRRQLWQRFVGSTISGRVQRSSILAVAPWPGADCSLNVHRISLASSPAHPTSVEAANPCRSRGGDEKEDGRQARSTCPCANSDPNRGIAAEEITWSRASTRPDAPLNRAGDAPLCIAAGTRSADAWCS